ncbi:MAG: ADYC domain-containing protein, partial [Nannocystaceae bacterium]
ALRAIELGDTHQVIEFDNNPLTIVEGWIAIEEERLQPKQIIGATLTYWMVHPIAGEVEMHAHITGLATLDFDSGEIPLYNIQWDKNDFLGLMGNGHWFGEGSTDKDPQLCDAAIDVEGGPYKPFVEYPGNKFSFAHAVTMYQDVGLDPNALGKVKELEKHVHMACLSAATGKSALWGYPAWVSPDNLLEIDSLMQLQASINVIRADYHGSGESFTKDGTPLQIRNRWVGAFSDSTTPTEAIWDRHGSPICLSNPRVPNLYDGQIEPCGLEHEEYFTNGKAFAWTKLGTTPATPLGQQDCQQTSNSPGCNDLGIEACVCASDSYCCSNHWDSICVSEVTGWSCDRQAACSPHNPAVPGCGHVDVQDCVCDTYPECCGTNWDDDCVEAVTNLGCGVCP